MNERSRRAAWCGLGAVLLSASCLAPAQVQAPAEPATPASGPRPEVVLAPVAVQGESRAPRELKTLATLYKARELFEKHHALAPQAALKFKVLARTRAEHQQALELALVTRHSRVPVPLDADDNFSIDPTWSRYPDDTEVRSKLLDGRVTWRADIRTPGWPSNERRLGDLRLQCRVGFFSGVARSDSQGLFKSLVRFVFSQPDACENAYSSGSSFADRPVFAVTLIDGARRLTLSNAMLHGLGDVSGEPYDWGFLLRERMFRLPMGDKAWSDDTRVVMEFADDPQQPVDADLLASNHALARVARELQAGVTRPEAVRERLGKAQERHFDSGRRLLRHLSVTVRPSASLSPELAALLPPPDTRLSSTEVAALMGKLSAAQIAAAASAASAVQANPQALDDLLDLVELVTLYDEQDRLLKFALRRLTPTQRYR